MTLDKTVIIQNKDEMVAQLAQFKQDSLQTPVVLGRKDNLIHIPTINQLYNKGIDSELSQTVKSNLESFHFN